MRLGLIEAHIGLHVEEGYIGGSGEVDGLGRGGRQDVVFAARERLFGRLRTHVI